MVASRRSEPPGGTLAASDVAEKSEEVVPERIRLHVFFFFVVRELVP